MSLSDRFPRWASGILMILQLAFALALIGLEFGSVYIDLAHGTIWIGFWAGLVFFYTAMVMCCFTVCCHNRYYGIYALIWSSICLALSGVVIYFNSFFVNNLCTCYLGDSLCCSVRGIPYFSSNYSSAVTACATLSGSALKAASCPSVPYEKLPYVRAQLAMGAGMMVVCLVYIVVFILSCLGIWPKKND